MVAWVRCFFRKRPFRAVEDVNVNYRAFLERMRECERRMNDYGYELAPAFVAELHRNAAWGARLKRVLGQ